MERDATDGSSIVETALDHAGPLSGAIWAELHTFLAIAELRSANRAAEALGITRQKIVRQIRRLHDVLGAELVVLTKKGALLTPTGHELAERLRSVDQTIYSLSRDLRADDNVPTGDVRVGISDGLAFIFLVPALVEFSKQFPRVRILLKRPNAYERLRENHTDIMIGFNQNAATDLRSKSLGRLHYRPFASRGYLAERGNPEVDVSTHDFIDTSRYSGGGVWEPWQRLIASGAVRHGCEISITYGIMIKAGLGIGLLPTYNACEPTLVPLGLGVEIDVPLHAVYLVERLQSKPVRLTLEWIVETLGESNPWLARSACLDPVVNGVPAGYRTLLNL